MKTIRVALIGFGNVGQGFAEILRDRGSVYQEIFDLDVRIVAVTDLRFGGVYHPDGLDPAALLSTVAQKQSFDAFPTAAEIGWDAQSTIDRSNADAIIEISYTDLDSGEPATSHIRQALENGIHVVTTNKGPIALNFSELFQLAQENDAMIGIEGTVMSGTPGLRLGADLLRSAGITKIEGILNGTTNFILTEMGKGLSYADALREAQGRGYAEADPKGDVEGHDAAGKIAILSAVLMGKPLPLDQIERTGILDLDREQMNQAAERQERWKLVGSVEKVGDDVVASVQPISLPHSHPFASVHGATNAITYSTELLGDVTLIGPGAGRVETGCALMIDLISIFDAT